MCRKFVLVSSLDKVEDRFQVSLSTHAPLLTGNYNISGGDATYVITTENPRQLQAFVFGMTPYWARRPMELINARAEGDKNPQNDPLYHGPLQIFLKKAFMKPLQSQRCLVLADAYYEWTPTGQPYLVYRQDKQRPFAMAGLYDHWQDPVTKAIISTFTIITITANSMLQPLGIKRMPVILSPGYERDWLKAERSLSQVLHQLRPLDAKKMNAYPVSKLINTPGLNDASLVTPAGERLQAETQPPRPLNTASRYYHKKRDAPQGSWGEDRMKGGGV